MYIVYIEQFENGKVNRYRFGRYDRARANEVAEELNRNTDYDTFYCVCSESEVESLGIK